MIEHDHLSYRGRRVVLSGTETFAVAYGNARTIVQSFRVSASGEVVTGMELQLMSAENVSSAVPTMDVYNHHLKVEFWAPWTTFGTVVLVVALIVLATSVFMKYRESFRYSKHKCVSNQSPWRLSTYKWVVAFTLLLLAGSLLSRINLPVQDVTVANGNEFRHTFRGLAPGLGWAAPPEVRVSMHLIGTRRSKNAGGFVPESAFATDGLYSPLVECPCRGDLVLYGGASCCHDMMPPGVHGASDARPFFVALTLYLEPETQQRSVHRARLWLRREYTIWPCSSGQGCIEENVANSTTEDMEGPVRTHDRLVYAVGHCHIGCVRMQLWSEERLLCDSEARYDAYGYLVEMSTCTWRYEEAPWIHPGRRLTTRWWDNATNGHWSAMAVWEMWVS